MKLFQNKAVQVATLIGMGIVITQLPIDEVEAWAMPHSATFVHDTIRAEATGLPKDVLPGVALTRVEQAGQKVVYAFAAAQPVDIRHERAATIGARCKVWKPALVRGEIAEVEYRYQEQDRAQSFFVRRTDCR